MKSLLVKIMMTYCPISMKFLRIVFSPILKAMIFLIFWVRFLLIFMKF